jgi:DNA modification methylase
MACPYRKPMTDGQILKGDARHMPLPDNSVDCVVTSPPYWGQRKYRGPSLIWPSAHRIIGPSCRHRWGRRRWYTERSAGARTTEAFSSPGPANVARLKAARWRRDAVCRDCGAWRGQLGLEPTPELYVEHLVEIFREVRRVLKPTGTCWIVISDSRPSFKGTCFNPGGGANSLAGHGNLKSQGVYPLDRGSARTRAAIGLKKSDMLGLPHDVVKALRADGWYWRDEIIWAKPNGMCESQRTRTTRAHENVFLLTKSPSPHYYFDFAAIMEPCKADSPRRLLRKHSGYVPPGQSPHHGVMGPRPNWRLDREGVNSRMHQDRNPNHPEARKLRRSGNKARLIGGRGRLNNHLGFNVPWEGLMRRKRSVWTVSVWKARGLGKHYATFPEKLIEPMILAGCPRGGVVLDPFAGSGTTGVVARRLARKFILIDLAYQDIQRKRLKADA